MITDAAFDRLIAIYEQDRILWAAVHAHMPDDTRADVGLSWLCEIHGINPDA
tara:strand:- start:2623 stop:2778 length:156 start_codon:yes stop_codon:yes gene_type:complete